MIAQPPPTDSRSRWIGAAFIIFMILLAVAVVWGSNLWLSDRHSQAARDRAEGRMALYNSSIQSELQRMSVVPLLLSRDPVLIRALLFNDFSATTRRLISYRQEIETGPIILLDADGRVVAATDRSLIGSNLRSQAYFIEGLRANETVFSTTQLETGAFTFTYSRRIESEKTGIGVVVVGVDLAALETRWAYGPEVVAVLDSSGTVLLATESGWKGRSLDEALAERSAPNAVERAIRATADWSLTPPDAILQGRAVLRLDARIPFRGWKLVYFTTIASIRDRVNGILALEIMGFALLVALMFYLLQRRAVSDMAFFKRESEELRHLNVRLNREMAERKRVQANLDEAQASLAQSSKLAALGEMSAAVSHELNQPLAAMRTYLAGAKLLLQRQRPDEALSSFQRIDDLIARMGAITAQLKSYARKGGSDLAPVDLRSVVRNSLAMMSPQLNQMEIDITRSLPDDPVWVMGDQMRLEQVVVNLLRNALDAMREKEKRELDILLSAGETATLTVRDNGSGIRDLEDLFEPFYTTKKPGDGVGLGLAISSGIVKDLGGSLTARNAAGGGAAFEVQLPRMQDDIEAAE